MSPLRAFFRDHRKVAYLLVALALVMKVMIPAGFMIGTQGMVLTVQICAEGSGEHLTKQIVIPLEGKSSSNHGNQGKADETCPFAGLSMASLGSVDPALLIIALAFILALGFAPIRAPRPKSASYLRPPLRGPPALV